MFLLSILLMALLLRLWGIDFGLPHIYHTDEWFEVKRALKLGIGVFDFDRIGKGGYYYLLFFEYGVYYTLLKILGIIKSGDDFLYRLFQNPSDVWLIGRVTTAIIGTLNCYILYLLGKHAFGRSVGLFASLFLAINILHVMSSHYITVDVPMTFLVTVCFLIMFWNSSNPRFTTLQYGLLGFFVALAIMTKIPSAIIILSVLVFHYTTLNNEKIKITPFLYISDRRFMVFSLIFVLVYVVGVPGVLFKAKGILQWGISFFSSKNPVAASPAWPHIYRSDSVLEYYIKWLFPLRYILITLFTIIGVILGTQKSPSKSLIFLTFILPYFYFLCNTKSIVHVFSRYLLPITPVLSLFAAIGITFVLEQSTNYTRYLKSLLFLLLALTIFPPLLDSVRYDFRRTLPDTRTIAREWVINTIPSNSKILLEGNIIVPETTTVPLRIKLEMVDGILLHYIASSEHENPKGKFYSVLKKVLSKQHTHHLILTGNKFQLEKALLDRDVDYVILRSEFIESFEFEQNRKSFPYFYKLVTWVQSNEFKLIMEFKPNGSVAGPRLLVYKHLLNV